MKGEKEGAKVFGWFPMRSTYDAWMIWKVLGKLWVYKTHAMREAFGFVWSYITKENWTDFLFKRRGFSCPRTLLCVLTHNDVK